LTLIIIGYLICIYDTYYWAKGEPYNRYISAVLYPTTKIIWAISTATLIWMCITGNGSFINKFLSWKVFIPLSRLTYSVYLTHVWIVWYYWGSRRDLVDLHPFTLLSLFSSVVFISYFLGAIFSLLFESPFFVLQTYLKDFLISRDKLNENCCTVSPNFKETKILIRG
jgi:peptidoglycan/LPS O-acetylase OafA/YrhL